MILEKAACRTSLFVAAAWLTATITTHATAAQPQQAESLVASGVDGAGSALCGDDGKTRCDWYGEEGNNVKAQQNLLMDELLTQLSERGDSRGQEPHHVSPRFAVYEIPAIGYAAYGHARGRLQPEQLDRLLNLRFVSAWKGGQYSGLNDNKSWDVYGASGDRMRARHPFNGDNKRARYAFSSWGGKRSSSSSSPNSIEEKAAFNAVGSKREPAFSSWGGKRTQKFYNWGGKRSVADEQLERMPATVADTDEGNGYSGEHAIMKRDVSEVAGGDVRQISTVAAAAAATPAAASHAKRLCISDSVNLQQLFNDFVEWSRKQPEQKKATFYNKMLNIRTLHSPENLSRRAGSFYPWGGKRNSKHKDN